MLSIARSPAGAGVELELGRSRAGAWPEPGRSRSAGDEIEAIARASVPTTWSFDFFGEASVHMCSTSLSGWKLKQAGAEAEELLPMVLLLGTAEGSSTAVFSWLSACASQGGLCCRTVP